MVYRFARPAARMAVVLVSLSLAGCTGDPLVTEEKAVTMGATLRISALLRATFVRRPKFPRRVYSFDHERPDPPFPVGVRD